MQFPSEELSSTVYKCSVKYFLEFMCHNSLFEILHKLLDGCYHTSSPF